MSIKSVTGCISLFIIVMLIVAGLGMVDPVSILGSQLPTYSPETMPQVFPEDGGQLKISLGTWGERVIFQWGMTGNKCQYGKADLWFPFWYSFWGVELESTVEPKTLLELCNAQHFVEHLLESAYTVKDFHLKMVITGVGTNLINQYQLQEPHFVPSGS